MPIRREYNKRRSSEQDVALMQMQIAAQTRNQQWHDYLCGKREELLARLRQQGYSPAGITGTPKYQPDILPGIESVQSVPADMQSSASTRWGLTRREAEDKLDTDHYAPESPVDADGEIGEHQEPGEGGDDQRDLRIESARED